MVPYGEWLFQTSTMSSETIYNTLGGVIQLYASIITLIIAIFILIIERNQTDFSNYKNKIIESIRLMNKKWGSHEVDFNDIIEYGIDNVLNNIPDESVLRIVENSEECSIIATYLPRYNILKTRQSSWAFQRIGALFLYSVMVPMSSLMTLNHTSPNEVLNYTMMLYYVSYVSALIGVLLFMAFISELKNVG